MEAKCKIDLNCFLKRQKKFRQKIFKSEIFDV